MNQQVRRMNFCLFILLVFLQVLKVNSVGLCLYLSDGKGSWPDALKHCIKYKMCLADIGTEITLQQLLHKLKVSDLEEYWFGLSAYNKTSFRYVSNNKPPEYMPPGSALVNTGGCAYLKPHEGTYLINSAACELHKKFICVRSEMCAGRHLEREKHSCVISEEHRAIVAV